MAHAPRPSLLPGVPDVDTTRFMPDLLKLLQSLDRDPDLAAVLQKDPVFLAAVSTGGNPKGLIRHVEQKLGRLQSEFINLRRLGELVLLGRGRIEELANAREEERALGAETDLKVKMAPYFSWDGEKSPLGALQFARAQGIPIILPGRLQPDWHHYEPGKRIGEVFRHRHYEYAVAIVDGGISLFFKAASGWLQVHTYNDEVANFFGESRYTDRSCTR